MHIALPIHMEVCGKDACFTRPKMRTERVSYDVITSGAARGMVEAVCIHSGRVDSNVMRCIRECESVVSFRMGGVD